MKCSVKFKLVEVACPGTLHLTNRNPLFISICLFGRIQNTQKIYPSFPMEINAKVKFQRCFTNAKTPEHVLEILEDETILIQLKQTKNGNKVIAQFEDYARKFLFPSPSYLVKDDEMRREILLQRNEFFMPNKSLDPQLIFYTQTSIKEEQTALAGCSDEKSTIQSLHHTPSPSSRNQSNLNSQHRTNKSLCNISATQSESIAPKNPSGLTKKHCICGCPALSVNNINEVCDNMQVRKSQSKKTKPFRTGKEPENLISKRNFEGNKSNCFQDLIRRGGFCDDCAVPLASCILCNAYKTVYGEKKYLRHRFLKMQHVNCNMYRQRSKSNTGQQLHKIDDRSPVKITVNNHSLEHSKCEHRNRCAFELALRNSVNKHLNRSNVFEYENSTPYIEHTPYTDLRGSSDEEDELFPHHSPFLSSNHSLHNNNTSTSFLNKHKKFNQSVYDSDVASSFQSSPKIYEHNDGSSHLNRKSKQPDSHNMDHDSLVDYSLRTKDHRAALFKGNHDYHVVHAKQKDVLENHTERIQHRIKELMIKNNSVLEHDVSTDSNNDDDNPIESVSKPQTGASRHQKFIPAKSFVEPVKNQYSCWANKEHVGKSHREMLDSSLNAIYGDLYDKITKLK